MTTETTKKHPFTASPRFLCTATTIVLGPERSKQEQIQLQRLPGTNRMMFPGESCLLIEDDQERFGRFVAGGVYEVSILPVNLPDQELDILCATKESRVGDQLDELFKEASAVFRAAKSRLEGPVTVATASEEQSDDASPGSPEPKEEGAEQLEPAVSTPEVVGVVGVVGA